MNDLVARTRSDQRSNWESGVRIMVETYFERHPELLGSEEVALDVIYSEILLREELGEVVETGEYVRRFPQYAPQLARQLELHRLVGVGALTPAAGPTTADPDGKLPDIPGYRFSRRLGAGSWGTVYEAHQFSLNRRVAVKILHPDARPGGDTVLRREAEAVARLNHKNIAQIYELGEHEGRAYAIIELVEGGSLAAALQARGVYPPADAAVIATVVARATHHAHEQGLVHRDLKPANVLLGADGAVKVTDFGLAKWLDEATSLAASGALIGTACYMAPEQARGGHAVGPAADVYAIGVILHELLTGRPPYTGGTFWDVLERVGKEDPPALPRRLIPRDLNAIRLKCLEKQAARRYPTALALAEDLERWLRQEPVVARPPSRARRFGRFVRRRKLLASGFGLLLVAAGIGGGIPAYRWYTDPLNRMRRALDRGERVTLVGPNGLPEWHRWRQWSSNLEVFDDGSQTASFRTAQLSLLELCPDPGRDRYRLTAEVCHLESPTNDGSVGIFVGLADQALEEGWRIDRWYGIEYSDFPVRGQQDPKTRWLDGIEYVVASHPDRTRQSSRPGVWSQPYPAPDLKVKLPPWRKLVIEVDRAEVRAEWVSEAGLVRPLPVFPMNPRSAQLDDAHRLFFGDRFPTLKLPAGEWGPRRGIGVYARRSTVGLRNVCVE